MKYITVIVFALLVQSASACTYIVLVCSPPRFQTEVEQGRVYQAQIENVLPSPQIDSMPAPPFSTSFAHEPPVNIPPIHFPPHGAVPIGSPPGGDYIPPKIPRVSVPEGSTLANLFVGVLLTLFFGGCVWIKRMVLR